MCSDCGRALGSARIPCPTCSTLNPPGQLECEACKAHLVPPGQGEAGPELVMEDWVAARHMSANGVETTAGESETGGADQPRQDRSALGFNLPSDASEAPSALSHTGEELSSGGEEAAILGSGPVPQQDEEATEDPYWLRRLKPRRSQQGEDSERLIDAEGLLLGLGSLIPASRIAEPVSTGEARPLVVTSEADVNRAELLQSLWKEPISKLKPSAGEKGSYPVALLERLLVAIVLVVPVLGVLLTPATDGGAPPVTQPLAAPGATRLYETVNQLETADVVLIAFDYGPPEADELSTVAHPILEHLIDMGVTLSIFSTRPDGLPVAETLMQEVARSNYDYTLVGYRPGAGTAISQLLAAVEEPPAMLLIVTSWPGSLQGWIEQTQARFGDRLPVAALGSAVLEPVTEPYADPSAGQLTATVHGLRDAAAYEALRGVRGDATQRLDALAAGHLAIVVLMITGAAVYGLSESRKRVR